MADLDPDFCMWPKNWSPNLTAKQKIGELKVEPPVEVLGDKVTAQEIQEKMQ